MSVRKLIIILVLTVLIAGSIVKVVCAVLRLIHAIVVVAGFYIDLFIINKTEYIKSHN